MPPDPFPHGGRWRPVTPGRAPRCRSPPARGAAPRGRLRAAAVRGRPRRAKAAASLHFASLCFVLLRFASLLPAVGRAEGGDGCAPASCPRRVQVRGCPGKAQTDPHQQSPEFAWQSCSNTFTEGFVYSQGLTAFQTFCLHKLLLTEAICFCLRSLNPSK